LPFECSEDTQSFGEVSVSILRVVIFGANTDGEYLYRLIRPFVWSGFMKVVAFADNDSRMTDLTIDGVRIAAPAELKALDFDKVIIAPIFGDEILSQLLSLGIPRGKVEFLHGDQYFSRHCRRFRTNTIGRYSYFKPTTQMISTDVGAFCHIGDNCIIGQSGHDVDRVTTYPLGYHFHNTVNDPSLDESATRDQLAVRTVIGNDVYIGEGVVIFAGVRIGDGAVIGSRAVVTSDIPDYGIATGVPARVTRRRFADPIVEALLKIRWWDWTDEHLARVAHLFELPPDQFVRAASSETDAAGPPA
jgi:acetyltransferase-like isoleucine patch superfamily enzyme